MLRIGIIGLGDIAQKAYLPLISVRNVEVHLCSRNEKKLLETGEQYRFKNLHVNIESFIKSGIQAAFVHTATASHGEVVEQLLLNNIHVYVDKPVTYDYASTERLFLLAEEKNLQLHVGFNRRMAPAYAELRTIPNPNMIMMQKNRKSLPGDVRTFVFDDFIHVTDTLLWLLGRPMEKMIVNGKKKNDLLYHLVVQFIAADGTTAIGIMNRDTGTVEERLEVFSSAGKYVVNNVTEASHTKDRNETRLIYGDWESTLYKRGFDQLIDNFLTSIKQKKSDRADERTALYTHKVCEEIVEKINGW